MGNTVVVIEHNLDVIKSADWLIEMGPEAGWQGGQVVTTGTPEQIVDYARREREQAVVGSSTAEAKPPRKRASKRSSPEAVTPVTSSPNNAPLLRCHTGEALAGVLAQGPYVERAKFDPQAHFRSQIGDIDLEQMGRQTLLPWQIDGRRWHTVDSTDRKGQAIRWDRQALIKIIEHIESHGGFNSVKWDDRSVVEVSAPGKKIWFLHAITAETWLLKLKFRFPRESFRKAELEEILSLPTLNEIPEIESYGNESRVRSRLAGADWELEIRAYTLAEIDKPSFWKWLNEAMKAYLGKDSEESLSPIAAEPIDLSKVLPWKALGQKWHLLRKGFPKGREVLWKPDTLERVAEIIQQTAAGQWKWDEETVARYFMDGQTEPWVTMHTKRPEGLIVVFTGPPLPSSDDFAGESGWNITTRGSLQQLQLCLTTVPTSFKKLATVHSQLFKG
jgi:excinuclease ABC subunit A